MNNVADYAFRTMEDRLEIEKLWEAGKVPKEIAADTGVSVHVVYKELARGQDGSRLPDQRLRYSAELAQRRVQKSLEARGKKTGQPAAGRRAGIKRAANS